MLLHLRSFCLSKRGCLFFLNVRDIIASACFRAEPMVCGRVAVRLCERSSLRGCLRQSLSLHPCCAAAAAAAQSLCCHELPSPPGELGQCSVGGCSVIWERYACGFVIIARLMSLPPPSLFTTVNPISRAHMLADPDFNCPSL